MLIDKLITAIKPHVNFNDIKVILDIGTRDLEQSKELRSIFPDAHIHAFEPNPESFDTCIKEAPDYVTVWPYALLDYDGETEFYSVIQKDNFGASSIFEPTDLVVGVDLVDGLNRIVVPCKRVDTWARDSFIPKIDLVWMDVQSAEIPALRGFGDKLNDVKALATEAVTGTLYYGNKKYEPSNYSQVKDFMESKGFVEIAKDQPWLYECDLVFLNMRIPQ